jgi:hypothetical protein
MLAGVVFVYLGSIAVSANAQSTPQPTKFSTLEGTVVSTSRATVVVKTADGLYQVFVIDRDTARPQTIPMQAPVKVTFTPTADPTAPPIAETVLVTGPAPPKVAALTGDVPAPEPVDEPVPASVRQLERDIQRQTSRWRLGIRGATSLDPELFMFGVHSQLGPFFSENVWARPTFEMGFGELTTLVSLNFEGVYRLPITQRTSRWNTYLGGGPALNFSHRNFVEETDRGKIDFGDLDLNVGFNFLIGIATREGLFLEMKTSAYSLPTLRFAIGYNF